MPGIPKPCPRCGASTPPGQVCARCPKLSRACAQCGRSIVTGSICAECKAEYRPDYGYSDPMYRRNKKLALGRADGKCERCFSPARPPSTRQPFGDPLEVHHVLAITDGGTHELDNLQVIHRSENLEARTPRGFITPARRTP